MAVTAATAPTTPELSFRQAGHWVYNHTLGAAFHIDGGSKQVDARVGKFDADVATHLTLQGDTRGYVVGSSKVVVFGKSTLSVDTTIPSSIREQPVGIEVRGGPYLVYRRAGTVVRLGVPPATIRAGGPLADPVRTSDGTVWVRRVDNGAVCAVRPGSDAVDCPVTVPAGHHAALTVVHDAPAVVDTTEDVVRPINHGLGTPVSLHVDLPDDARVSDADTSGRLAVLDPTRNVLVLADTSGGSAAITVPLGRGRFGAPVGTQSSIAIVEESANRLLTFDPRGRRHADTTLAAGQLTVLRGEDGRVYVDDAAGAHTLVVDPDGSVTRVDDGGADLPTAPPRNHPSPKPSAGRSSGHGTRQSPPVQSPSVQSPPVRVPSVRVPPSPPSAPHGITAQPGDSTVTTSWGAASPNGARISNYQVSWRPVSGDGPPGSLTVGGNQLTATPSGLHNGTTYVVTVAAENTAGRGPGIDSAPVMPSSDIPAAPTGVTATAAPDGSVAVSWQAADGRGHRISRYDVTAKGTDGSTTPAGQTAGTELRVQGGQDIALGTTYAFSVTAVNDRGLSGPPSTQSGPATPYRPADAPGGFAATAPRDGTIDLSWAPPNLGGGELVHYLVAGGNGLADQTVTGTTAEYTGLADGTAYQFQVRAVTRERGRTGGPTAQGTPATTAGTPGTTATVDVTAATLSGDRQVTVTVAVNDRNSGAVNCHLFFNGQERWSGGCGNGQAIAVGGLDYSTTYDVSGTGSNGYGTGNPGGHASVRTNDPPPPPPSATVSKGAPITRSDCTDPSCARIHVSLRNFAPGTHSITCRSDDVSGGFYTYRTANADSDVCYYGFPGKHVWVSVDGGTESNHLQW